MSIWKRRATLDLMNQMGKNTMVRHLEIEFTEVGHDYLKASMPVNKKTHQPMGLLHGGASVALAETIGSTGANMACDDGLAAVGQSINANHIRGVRDGYVHATAKAVHIGRTSQVWAIDIVDDQQKLICTSRLTMAVIKYP